MFDITVTIIFHREGAFALPALASMQELVFTAREAGISVEARAVLDNVDDLTRQLVSARGIWLDEVEEVSFGDLGLSRNKGTLSANGEFLAFLDGDDLWGSEWLRLAYRAATASNVPKDAIWHPESLFIFDWNDFEGQSLSSHLHHGTNSFHYLQHLFDFSDFLLNTALLESIWSSNVFARRSIYLAYPYKAIDKEIGFGVEDMSWNIETIWANIPHLVVDDTVHVIRAKESDSLHKKNVAEGLLPYLPEHARPKFGIKR